MKDYYSVSDIERFAYCPLNFLLYLEGVDVKSEKGENYHKKIIDRLRGNILIEKRVNILNNVFYVLAILAIAAILFFFYYTMIGSLDYLFLLSLSIFSIYIAFWFYLLSNFFNFSLFKKADSIILYLIFFSLFVLFLALIVFKIKYIILPILILSSDMLLLIAAIAYYALLKDIKIIDKIPQEERDIKYIDSYGSELLRSKEWRIQGRPDIIAEINGEIVPIEIKSSNMPKVKPFSHVMQLTAYSILVEEKYGRRVYYGILKYPQGNMEIEIDENLRETLRSLIKKMDIVLSTMTAHRNHNNPGKCQGCYRKDYCPESLV